MIKNEITQGFIEKIKKESSYRKPITDEAIKFLIKNFPNNYKKLEYKKTINQPLDVALNFFEGYNKKYYEILKGGLENKTIIISNEIKFKSKLDIQTGVSTISLKNDDEDVFLIIHELAHYLDFTQKILPKGYSFLCEIISYYIEKAFSKKYIEKYESIIKIRNNNRAFNECQMLKAIEYEFYYENLYKQQHQINNSDINIDKVKYIFRYKSDNTINYLLRYFIGDIISNYMIINNIGIDNNTYKEILKIDFFEAMNLFFMHK
ncbi:MAG: hypothetical protein J6A89_00735 [Clostridia bacterium]|nr:hypothetical protein [Clostridia bacterium]